MSENGYFRVSRSLVDSWVWRLDKGIRVWLWLIHRARWKAEPEKIPVGRQIIEVRRGQVWTTERNIAVGARVSRQVVRSTLDLLRTNGAISTHSLAHRGTMITLCNYEAYQGSTGTDNPLSNQRATQSQPTDSPIRIREEGQSGEEKNAPPSFDLEKSAREFVRTRRARTIEDGRKLARRLKG